MINKQGKKRYQKSMSKDSNLSDEKGKKQHQKSVNKDFNLDAKWAARISRTVRAKIGDWVGRRKARKATKTVTTPRQSQNKKQKYVAIPRGST